MTTELDALVIHYRLAYVEWQDSYGVSAIWQETKNAKPIQHKCFSVGWIIAENEDVIVLVPHLSPANNKIDAEEQGCGDMTIPKCSIVKINLLG